MTTKIKEEKKIVQIKDKGADSCDETDSDAEAEGGRWNPYTEFLQNIEDEDSEDEEVCFKTSHQSQFERESSSQVGLAGGLKSWLGFAGSMTGTAALSAGPEKRVSCGQMYIYFVNMTCLTLQTPWIKSDKSGDDAMTRKAEENMTRIGDGMLHNYRTGISFDLLIVYGTRKILLSGFFPLRAYPPTPLMEKHFANFF